MKKQLTKTSKAVVAQVAASVQRISASARLELSKLFMIGVDSFNGYVSKGDVQLGACEKFTFPLGPNGEAINVYRHEAQSCWVVDGLLLGNGKVDTEKLNWCRENADIIRLAFIEEKSERGFYVTRSNGVSFIGENELRALAQSSGDFRRFKVTFGEHNAKEIRGRELVLAGIVIGDMSAKRQGLVYFNGKKLAGYCLTTGKIADGEPADRAVEMGALNDADKLTLKTSLFAGIDVNKGKQIEVNHKRALRKHANGTARALNSAASRA